MFRKTSLLVTILMALFISACAGTGDKNGEGSGSSAATDDANAWGTGYSKSELAALGITKNPLEYTTVYFEYDSSQIDKRSEIIITAHSKSLTKRANVNVVLEGHTDERGTREYNLALGERRAGSVQSLMKTIGAGNNALSLVTYGEERPVSLTQDEKSWEANRRVQILY
jgi:peptidoglycan-associated lipoprotein